MFLYLIWHSIFILFVWFLRISFGITYERYPGWETSTFNETKLKCYYYLSHNHHHQLRARPNYLVDYMIFSTLLISNRVGIHIYSLEKFWGWLSRSTSIYDYQSQYSIFVGVFGFIVMKIIFHYSFITFTVSFFGSRQSMRNEMYSEV